MGWDSVAKRGYCEDCGALVVKVRPDTLGMFGPVACSTYYSSVGSNKRCAPCRAKNRLKRAYEQQQSGGGPPPPAAPASADVVEVEVRSADDVIDKLFKRAKKENRVIVVD